MPMTILKMINDSKTIAYYFVCSAGMINSQIVNSKRENAKITWFVIVNAPFVTKKKIVEMIAYTANGAIKNDMNNDGSNCYH